MSKSASKAKKPATKSRSASASSDNPNITYTHRTCPRPTWERFAKRMKDEGRSIDWAFNRFITLVADGQFKFE